MKNFTAIDFETANPQRVSACSLGIVTVKDGQIVDSRHYLIRPIGGHATFQSKIHGIKDEHTRDKPQFNGIYRDIEHIFELPVIGHSLFDKQVLNALSEYFNLNINFQYSDSCGLAKSKLPGLKNHKLPTLVKHFGLPSFKHHDASEDAIACANIFLKLHGIVEGNTLSSPETLDSEFRGLVEGVLADGEISYKEAFTVLYWLDEHPDFASKNQHLHSSLRDMLNDDYLDLRECKHLEGLLREHMKKI